MDVDVAVPAKDPEKRRIDRGFASGELPSI
jgi:hypothetical protein